MFIMIDIKLESIVCLEFFLMIVLDNWHLLLLLF